jgi:hypothetical protein
MDFVLFCPSTKKDLQKYIFESSVKILLLISTFNYKRYWDLRRQRLFVNELNGKIRYIPLYLFLRMIS